MRNWIYGMIAFTAFYSTTLPAQNESLKGWVLQEEKTNLKVYTRPDERSGIKEVRIIATIKTTIPSLMAALNDVDGYTEWVYKCEQPKKLTVNSPQDFYYYTKTDLPFPVADRDLVVHSKQWKDAQTGVVYSRSVASPNYISKEKDVVRIQTFESFWHITDDNNG